MKKNFISFILLVAWLTTAYADGYTGIMVANGDLNMYYLFEEQPAIRYQQVEGVKNACLYTMGNSEPIISVPLQNGTKLSVCYDVFARVILNDEGYATFSSKDSSYIATEGVKAYKAAVVGEAIILTELTGNIPASTGIVLYGETAGTKVDLPVATTGYAADVTSNSLKPTTLYDGSIADKEENSWALGDGNQFLLYIGNSYVPNRAYLVHEHNADARQMQLIFEGSETTNLDNVISEIFSRDGKFFKSGKVVIVKSGMKYSVEGQIIK